VNDWTKAKTPGQKVSFTSAIPALLVVVLVVGTVCAWLLYTIYSMGNSLWQVYLLKSRGQPAVAKVTAYTPETRRAGSRHRRHIRVHFHTVEFNGHSGSVRLPQETSVGTEIRVLYLPEAPEVVTAGERHDSLMRLLRGKAIGGTAWDGMMCSVGVVFLLLKLVVIGGTEQLLQWFRKLFSRSHQTN
jgi:hypothetical protein